MSTMVKHETSRAHHSPTIIMSEIAGEGVANFIESQKVLFNLAQEQTNLLMSGVKERIGNQPAAHAVADTLRRSVDTFIDMQQALLKIAGKQTHAWVEASKTGKPYKSEHVAELTREGMETFVKAQKKFLDVIVEETEKAISGKRPHAKKIKKTDLSNLARRATNSFVEAQKTLFDVAGRQINANVKAAGKTLELIKPFPFVRLAELTRKGVRGYAYAQKALMGVISKSHAGHKHEAELAHRAKRVARLPKKASGATAAAA